MNVSFSYTEIYQPKLEVFIVKFTNFNSKVRVSPDSNKSCVLNKNPKMFSMDVQCSSFQG